MYLNVQQISNREYLARYGILEALRMQYNWRQEGNARFAMMINLRVLSSHSRGVSPSRKTWEALAFKLLFVLGRNMRHRCNIQAGWLDTGPNTGLNEQMCWMGYRAN